MVSFTSGGSTAAEQVRAWVAALRLREVTPGFGEDILTCYAGKLGSAWLRIDITADDDVYDAQAQHLLGARTPQD